MPSFEPGSDFSLRGSCLAAHLPFGFFPGAITFILRDFVAATCKQSEQRDIQDQTDADDHPARVINENEEC